MASKNTSSEFFGHFEHIVDLSAAFVEGELDLLRPVGFANRLVPPRVIEITGGCLVVVRQNGTEHTTRDYANWDKFYGTALKIIETGTTAASVQIFW